MQPAAGGFTDVLGDIRGKRNNIVIKGTLQFLAPFNAERCPRLHLREIFLRHEAFCTKSFTGEEFDLKPELSDYHLALLEKALVVEQSEGIHSITPTGRLYLEKVEARS